MPHRVALAPGALDDLRRIYVYIADTAGTDIADAYDLRLRAACRGLADFPRRGTPHDDIRPGLRSMAFERRATIFYEVQAENVRIIRILHRGRDPAGTFAQE